MFAPPDVDLRRRADGSVELSSRQPLAEHETSPLRWLARWSAEHPTRVLLAERPDRDLGTWRTLTYGAAAGAALAIGAALLERGLGRAEPTEPGASPRPLMMLAGNSIDHALVMLGCYVAGVPFAPVSTAYSQPTSDLRRITELVALVRPAAVFVDDSEVSARALGCFGASVAVLATTSHDGRATELRSLLPASDQPTAAASPALDAPRASIAKVLFTSGSTGVPKAVIQTHGMLTANQQSLAQVWPFVAEEPPVLVDWLPWSHVFGANNNFNMVLRNGGTHYIDHGRPAPELLPTTLANLRDVAPTILFNVPAGYAALLPHLERDDGFARHVYSRLRMVFYAGAALPQDLWDRLGRLAERHRGEDVPRVSSWGSTETAPACTAVHTTDTQRAAIGTPIPGVTVKLVPSGDKLELRVKGPNVTPGYLHQPDVTAAAFDDEGFFRMGDAGRLADGLRPERGLLFDGRTSEDFKLTTGTWVSVGRLRVELLSLLAPWAADALIAGNDRAGVRALVWPSEEARARIVSGGWDSLAAELGERLHAQDPALGSSRRVERVLVLADRPSLDTGELTDKGYVNQRTALAARDTLVAQLYAADAPLVIDSSGRGT